MDNFSLVSFIILSISMAEFAIQISVSDLAYKVKGYLLLNQPYNKKLTLMSSKNFWLKLFGKGWWLVAIPFILLIKLHEFISELFACPWCTSFHLSWISSYLYLHTDIITALLLAPISLVAVTILDRIHTHE